MVRNDARQETDQRVICPQQLGLFIPLDFVGSALAWQGMQIHYTGSPQQRRLLGLRKNGILTQRQSLQEGVAERRAYEDQVLAREVVRCNGGASLHAECKACRRKEF